MEKFSSVTCATAVFNALISRMGQTALIGSSEAAKILGISRSYFHHKVKAGEIAPVAKLPGSTGVYLFSTELINQMARETQIA